MEQDKISGKQFYELITSANTSEINQISDHIIQRMAFYLSSVMKADEEIAKDCAQQAFEQVYTKIAGGSITDIEDIFGYLIRAAKNEYLIILRRDKDKIEVPNEYSYFLSVEGSTGEEVVDSIYSEEKEKLLEYCIEKLRRGRKKFFLQVLKFINEKDKDAAKKLNMSYGNFRTRKSRVVEALQDCVKNALKENQ